MKILCELVGGSHLYGLSTPASDMDYRYIFLHDDLRRAIGLDRFEHSDERNDEEDRFGFEIRHYLGLLRRTNTQVVEVLYADKFMTLDPAFKALVLDHKEKFLNSAQFYKSLKGYIQGERRLANGERQGRLGGARKESIDKYGFSPKNFVQLLRLARCGHVFFTEGYYPVNIQKYDRQFAGELLDIKLNPEKYTPEQLNLMVDVAEANLDHAFATRDVTKDYKFDEDYAANVLLELYYPIINGLYRDYYKKLSDKEKARVLLPL